jgi:hypothetical protein
LDAIENILNQDESKQLSHSLTSNSRDRVFKGLALRAVHGFRFDGLAAERQSAVEGAYPDTDFTHPSDPEIEDESAEKSGEPGDSLA